MRLYRSIAALEAAPRQRVTVRETTYEPLPAQPRLLVRQSAPVYAVQAAPLFVPAATETTVYRGPLGRTRKVVVRTSP